MDVGDIRPRQVIDEEDDNVQVLSSSNVQASGSHNQSQASASGSHDNVQDQQVASTSSQPNASNVPVL